MKKQKEYEALYKEKILKAFNLTEEEVLANASPTLSEVLFRMNQYAVDYVKSPLGRLNLALRRSPEEFEKEWNRIIKEARAK